MVFFCQFYIMLYLFILYYVIFIHIILFLYYIIYNLYLLIHNKIGNPIYLKLALFCFLI